MLDPARYSDREYTAGLKILKDIRKHPAISMKRFELTFMTKRYYIMTTVAILSELHVHESHHFTQPDVHKARWAGFWGSQSWLALEQLSSFTHGQSFDILFQLWILSIFPIKSYIFSS